MIDFRIPSAQEPWLRSTYDAVETSINLTNLYDAGEETHADG
jgi:hypothetical protein